MSGLRIVNLVKKFGTAASAVDGVTFEVKSGEFVVLLGPSGCGKTTTLRCIAGLESLDGGDVYVDGERINEIPPKDRDIALVFQNYALYSHMTVYDNIAYPLKMRKLSKDKIDSRVREVAKLLGLENLLSRKPSQLSGGEQQRVALGRAISRKPRIFLMDEPLSNLDAKLRVYMRAELKKLQRELGVTTVYVTHDQAEAMAMPDKIAIMDHGKIQQYGSPSEIYNKPSNVFVAGFVGNPPMNLIRMSVSEENGSIVLNNSEFSYHLPKNLADQVAKAITNHEVYLGIRPEDFQISLERNSDSIFESRVYVYEPTGFYAIVNLGSGGNTLNAIVPSSFKLDPGVHIWAGFSPEKIRIYDAKTQNLVV